jgi:hypothetical protein
MSFLGFFMCKLNFKSVKGKKGRSASLFCGLPFVCGQTMFRRFDINRDQPHFIIS